MAVPAKVSRSFTVVELVPKSIYERFGAQSKWFLDPEIIKLAQFIRDWFEAPMTINNWFTGGSFSERGYRIPSTKTGGEFSQHKRGAALDFNIRGLTANQVRAEIIENYRHFMKAGLTTLEHQDYATTWIHADNRWVDLDTLLIVKPVRVLLQDFEERDPNEYYKVGSDGVLVPIDFYPD